MYSKILELLIININQKIKKAKVSLETEEKAKEIANLQGGICGLRILLGHLKDLFGFHILYDSEEDAPVIEGYTTTEIKEFHEEMASIVNSALWKELLKRAADNKEQLKEMLITTADNARDLYLAQAQQAGLTFYDRVFSALRDEFARRKEELDFDADAAESTKDTTKNKQPRLPAPKKGNGKGRGKKK